MNVQHTKPLTVHPAAEAYRLMTDEELAALAADIAENGQHDPIILGRVVGSTEQHQIVDGRNRAKACGIAGTPPKFDTREFESEESIRAFVKSRSERRDLTKGQRAMGVALLFPDPDKRGRGPREKQPKQVVLACSVCVMLGRFTDSRQSLLMPSAMVSRVLTRLSPRSLPSALSSTARKQSSLDSVPAHPTLPSLSTKPACRWTTHWRPSTTATAKPAL